MKNIYLLDIEGANTANVKYVLQNDFRIITIKKPSQIEEDKPNIIMPGNGAFGYYISFLKDNKWETILSSIINKKNGGKLLSICSGFQALGNSSEESKDIEGLKLINHSFYNVNKNFNSGLIINIGRKEIEEVKDFLKLNDLNFDHKLIENNPYFVHGYAAKLNYESFKKDNKHCYLFTKINNEKLLAGIISSNFCGTQFHPELSGRLWKEFMITFFK